MRYRPILTGNLCLMITRATAAAACWPWPIAPSSKRCCPALLDPAQFLSDFGLRSLSRGLPDEPYVYDGNRVAYEPGESASPIYGGNSNWRGPIWFPVNYLMIEALREYHRYYGSSLTGRAAARWTEAGDARDAAAEIADAADRGSSSATRPAAGRSWATRAVSDRSALARPHSVLSSTSTATTARAWVPATRRAGPPWSPDADDLAAWPTHCEAPRPLRCLG